MLLIFIGQRPRKGKETEECALQRNTEKERMQRQRWMDEQNNLREKRAIKGNMQSRRALQWRTGGSWVVDLGRVKSQACDSLLSKKAAAEVCYGHCLKSPSC